MKGNVARDVTKVFCPACVFVQNGSVDGALSSRPPMPGRAAIRLDWAARVSIAHTAARGLADLRKASIGSVASPVAPSRILLHEPATPLLRPPDILELLSAPQVETSMDYSKQQRCTPGR